MRKKPTIAVPDDARAHAVAALRAYFADHMDEEIGDLKAGLLFDFVLAELGLSECQAIWAVHGNTDNRHVHIAVNRIHPITFRTLSAGDGGGSWRRPTGSHPRDAKIIPRSRDFH